MTYQQTGGFPPPKKSNTAVIVSIVVLVLGVLGAVGITGFVAPGFLLAADDDTGRDAMQTSGPDAATAPREVMRDFIATVNSGDVDGADDLYCNHEYSPQLPLLEDAIKRNAKLVLGTTVPGNGTTEGTHLSRVTGSIDGSTGEREPTNGTLLASKNGDKGTTWCVNGLYFPPAAGIGP